MDNKMKLIKWLKEPIVSKKWDRFVNFLLAFIGATISTTVYPQTDMPFWQFLLWMMPFAVLLVLIIKVMGTVWKNNRKQHDGN